MHEKARETLHTLTSAAVETAAAATEADRQRGRGRGSEKWRSNSRNGGDM